MSRFKSLKLCKVVPGALSSDHTARLTTPGLAFLDKALFSNYTYHALPLEDENDDEPEPHVIQISLDSLIETLQIFGVNENRDRWSSRDPTYGGISGSMSRGGPAAAFDNRVLGMAGVCRLSYDRPGAPFSVILEETGVTTTCELVTYEPEPVDDIPIHKDALCQKIIMRASWLYDAINELSTTSPTRVTMTASPTAPYFALSSNGPHGSATVEFSKDPELLETFQVTRRVVNTYKYALIRGASRAMAMATKVSIRGDEQGVLSLQFLIELEGVVSFVDFKFVPFLPEDGEGDESEREEDHDEFETLDDD